MDSAQAASPVKTLGALAAAIPLLVAFLGILLIPVFWIVHLAFSGPAFYPIVVVTIAVAVFGVASAFGGDWAGRARRRRAGRARRSRECAEDARPAPALGGRELPDAVRSRGCDRTDSRRRERLAHAPPLAAVRSPRLRGRSGAV